MNATARKAIMQTRQIGDELKIYRAHLAKPEDFLNHAGLWQGDEITQERLRAQAWHDTMTQNRKIIV